jgi:hypothetical protein
MRWQSARKAESTQSGDRRRRRHVRGDNTIADTRVEGLGTFDERSFDQLVAGDEALERRILVGPLARHSALYVRRSRSIRPEPCSCPP